jgi:DNA-binding CsgD family transcriptional regulator
VIDNPAVHNSVQRPHLLDVRAQLRLSQRRQREALDDALGRRRAAADPGRRHQSRRGRLALDGGAGPPGGPSRKGLELSYRGSAPALAYHAETELSATGARPRRILLSGVESLTPSERRVADLADEGLTTRQIAEALFVTPETVEFHLRHTCQKLDISSRTQLADALAAGSFE